MDQTNNVQKILELICAPAFAVRDGVVTHCNREAQGCLFLPGMAVADMLLTGEEEYSTLTDGCLYLQLRANERNWGASITRLEDGSRLFCLEAESIPTEIKAMSLLCAELRYPVSSLSLLTDRILANSESVTEAGAVTQELSRILRILNNVANTQNCMAAEDSHKEAQEVCALLDELMEECAALLEQAGITVEYSLPQMPIYSMLHVQAFRQSVYNLLDNAAKYTPKGGKIRVALTRSGNLLRLSVTDEGEGIAEDAFSNLFDRYKRQPGIYDSRQSLGLGLALVRAAAAAHKGTVLVDHPAEKGTRVTMTLRIQAHTTTFRSESGIKVVSSADDGRVMLSNVLPVSVYEPLK